MSSKRGMQLISSYDKFQILYGAESLLHYHHFQDFSYAKWLNLLQIQLDLFKITSKTVNIDFATKY